MRETTSDFNYSDERFADIQLLRYRLDGFEQLSVVQKKYIYCLAQATLYGRDITFDQFGKHNLKIRSVLETVVTSEGVNHDSDDFRELEVYLKRVWFSNGIHHHYGQEKFIPGFSEDYFRRVAKKACLEDGGFGNELGLALIERPRVAHKDIHLIRYGKPRSGVAEIDSHNSHSAFLISGRSRP